MKDEAVTINFLVNVLAFLVWKAGGRVIVDREEVDAFVDSDGILQIWPKGKLVVISVRYDKPPAEAREAA